MVQRRKKKKNTTTNKIQKHFYVLTYPNTEAKVPNMTKRVCTPFNTINVQTIQKQKDPKGLQANHHQLHCQSTHHYISRYRTLLDSSVSLEFASVSSSTKRSSINFGFSVCNLIATRANFDTGCTKQLSPMLMYHPHQLIFLLLSKGWHPVHLTTPYYFELILWRHPFAAQCNAMRAGFT